MIVLGLSLSWGVDRLSSGLPTPVSWLPQKLLELLEGCACVCIVTFSFESSFRFVAGDAGFSCAPPLFPSRAQVSVPSLKELMS